MNVKKSMLFLLFFFTSQTYGACIKSPVSEIEIMINEAAIMHRVDPNLVWAVAYTESRLNSCAVSKAGAAGVMQLMPATAKDLGVSDRFDAAQNVEAGVRYLSQQIHRFNTPQLYLAAYNAGSGAVIRKRRVPNYPETRKYIRLVVDVYAKRVGHINTLDALTALSRAAL